MNTLFKNLTVIDTETTNLHADKAEIVEIAGATWCETDWNTQSLLLGALNGIPPEASAKNNISQRMIEGLPDFEAAQDAVCKVVNWPGSEYFVAHNARYDRSVLEKAWQRCDRADYVQICRDNSRWLCTWRLSQHLLKHDFPDCEYGLNYLRYRLDLPVPDSIQLHRAKDDTYLCAKLFEFLVDYAVKNDYVSDDDILASLNSLCWKSLPITKWPFGKYRGVALTDIPNDYYNWALNNLPALNEKGTEFDWDLAENIRQVLETRIL